MKNLNEFKSSLPVDCILDTNSAEDIKGGFRFVTEDVYQFINKVYQLFSEGKSINWGMHGSEYCVEW
jgi:hypothetical protein